MKLNGKQFILSKEMTITDFLKLKDYSHDKVAVELNGQIIPKANFKNITLKNSDEVEIVSFVGGG